jgi:AsmA protein
MKLNISLRTILIGVGAIFSVLVLAIVVFFAFFPADLAAREAERRIEAATGRDLVLSGDVSVSFWPALGFSVEQAALSNPEGFPQDEPFIAADRIVFAVAVMPLLRGAIEVKELIFEGAEVRMLAKTDGAANWTFPTEETAPEEQATIEDLRLDDVRLIDGLISFQGAESETPLVLGDVDASLSLESLDAPAQIDAAFDYRGERMTVDGDIGLPRAVLEKGETPIAARVRSRPLNADFDGGFNAATGALQGALQANGSSLRRLLAWMGSPMEQGGGFGAFRVSGQMAREGETTALANATIRLDDIEARGDLSLINQENGRLRVNGALSAANVDLNPYLPAPTQGPQQGVEVDTAWSQAPLDLSGLRALDANLNLSLGALRFQRMSFSDVALNLRVANGAADARLTRVSLYGGGGVARLIADGSGAMPRVAVEIDAQNVQAEPLLRDAIGFDRIVGRGRLTASLVGQGGSQAAIMRSLRGNASFMFNDGQWKGVNLAQVARTVQSALSGQATGQGAATDFAELGANLAVANGVAATEDLRLLNPFVRLEGRGLVDIGAQTIDMRIVPRAVRSIEGQGGQADIAGLGVPFRVSGPWSRVSFRPALEDIVQSQVRDILGQQEEGSPLATLGDILFGRQPAEEAPAETPAEQPAEGEAQAPEQPAPQEEEEEPRNPLEDLFRRAITGAQEKQEEPAPSP